MKRVASVIIIVLMVVIVGIFLINVKNVDTDVTKKQTKVGVLMIGNHNDRSYNQSHYEAVEKTAEELNLNVTYKESAPTDESCKEIMEELIADGCEVIICNSYDYGEYIKTVAEANPDIYFFHASGIEQSNNLTTYFGRMYQMRYLSGIVAGLQTENNRIGYVAAFPISEVNRGINAFTLGVREVNPDAEVHVVWCDSWTDDKAAGDAAELLFSEVEVDVIAMHTDSIRVLQMAETVGCWSIGYNIDNSKNFPETFLTAPVWQWENYYTPYILKCLQGKFNEEYYWEGASTGMVGLAPLTDNVKTGTEKIVEAKMKELFEGYFDVFYGPIYDNEGNLRIAEGENMSDDAMLNRFDWYVEGVVIYEAE